MFELGFEKRTKYELFDLKKDKDTINNVAGKAEYSEIQQELHKKLMEVLVEQQDPRIIDKDCRFEH